jgi:hypothetical protein
MSRITISLLLTAACCLLADPPSAKAQSRYRAASPTISPWINLQRRDPGPLGSYLSNVRPEQQLRETLGDQERQLRSNAGRLAMLGQELRQTAAKQTVRPTGTASTFMNYSHYYPGESAGAASGARSARGR